MICNTLPNAMYVINCIMLCTTLHNATCNTLYKDMQYTVYPQNKRSFIDLEELIRETKFSKGEIRLLFRIISLNVVVVVVVIVIDKFIINITNIIQRYLSDYCS